MADSKDHGVATQTTGYRRGSVKDIEEKQRAGKGADLDLPTYDNDTERHGSEAVNMSGLHDNTHRKLKARHIQLIGFVGIYISEMLQKPHVGLTYNGSIGGTIGTALYVQIGRGLLNGGPASLFIAFTMWCSVILAVTLCMAEMVTYLPISSPFIRFAGRYGDEAFGFAVSIYNASNPISPKAPIC